MQMTYTHSRDITTHRGHTQGTYIRSYIHIHTGHTYLHCIVHVHSYTHIKDIHKGDIHIGNIHKGTYTGIYTGVSVKLE